jgi:hypothetical protein
MRFGKMFLLEVSHCKHTLECVWELYSRVWAAAMVNFPGSHRGEYTSVGGQMEAPLCVERGVPLHPEKGTPSPLGRSIRVAFWCCVVRSIDIYPLNLIAVLGFS